MKYLVKNDISIRKSPDPDSADWDVFVDFEAGKIVDNFPAHTNIEWLLQKEYIEEVKLSKKQVDIDPVVAEGV